MRNNSDSSANRNRNSPIRLPESPPVIERRPPWNSACVWELSTCATRPCCRALRCRPRAPGSWVHYKAGANRRCSEPAANRWRAAGFRCFVAVLWRWLPRSGCLAFSKRKIFAVSSAVRAIREERARRRGRARENCRRQTLRRMEPRAALPRLSLRSRIPVSEQIYMY